MSYASLLATLDAWFSRGSADAGPGVVPCRRGCSACCHGPFDISPADAALIAEGVAALPEAERSAMHARARSQLSRCAALLPGWGPPWLVAAVEELAFDTLTEQLAGDPCPALDPGGGCGLYEHRPATCRMTGLAMDLGSNERLDNHCPIQADFPAYAALQATPFDLQRFEDEAEVHDARAADRGHASTTVAGAIEAALRGPGTRG